MVALVLVILLAIFIFGCILVDAFKQTAYLVEKETSDKLPTKRADELPKLPKTIDQEKWEHDKCMKCSNFDGYDVCLCKHHWGSVIQNTVEYCEKYGSFRYK